MNPLLLGPLLEIGKGLIDRLMPNPEEKAKAELELLKMAQDGDLKTVLAQLDINAKEAQSPSLFVSGGRPFFLWIGGVGFGYAVLLQPLLAWVAQIKGWPLPPVPDVDLLWVVVSGLLGISGMRSVEKVKGVASK
jgi:hypothetical protein